MATAQRSPRDVIFEADAEYQRLAEKHKQYEVRTPETLPLSLPQFRRSDRRNPAKKTEAPRKG